VPLPFLTADQPGIGGLLREAPEDFEVEELPAYLPSGTGEHIFAFIEKRDLTTPFAVTQLARALGVPPRDLGTAGLKDRRAVTRQWVSLPPPVTLEKVRALAAENSIPGLRILEVAPHPHKLRTGHLRGNRFTLVVRRALPGAADRARAILQALAAAPGAPNWYGEQRFGREGDNAAAGLALVRKERRFDRDPRKNRLLVSALQSQLFNQWLERRVIDGLYRAVLPGELLRKVAGGVFASTEPDVDQARLLAGEVIPTGPMFGVEMRGPVPDSEAARREAEVLAAAGLSLAELAPLKKLAPGARRDAAIAIADWSVEQAPASPGASGDGEAVIVRFTLPAGAYATAVMRELQKPEPGAPAEATDGGDGDPGGDAEGDSPSAEESDASRDRAGNTSTPSPGLTERPALSST
jgi:tRNA pseudouridine13 synthase